jgi:tetratricopeptide (TPR) repeat protein
MPGITPNWEDAVYSQTRIQQWLRGEITLGQLHILSGPEMLEMAMIGFQMFEQGRYKDAKAIFEGLVCFDPKEAYYRTACGAVALATEDLDNALYCFTVAIQLSPKEIASYVNRGEVFLRQGKIVEAANDFKKAIDLDPKDKDPLTMRARLLSAAAIEALYNAGVRTGIDPEILAILDERKKARPMPSAPAKKGAPVPKAPLRGGGRRK